MRADPALSEPTVTCCVDAGVAASDVLCCAALGVHHQGQQHSEAVGLLARVDKVASRHLGTLLGLKTTSAYSARMTPRADVLRAWRAAEALVVAAGQV
jgi:hypothetical protein